MEKISSDFEDAMSRKEMKEMVMKALRNVGLGSSDFVMLCMQLDNLDRLFVEIQRAIEAGIKDNVARDRMLEERQMIVVQEEQRSNFLQAEIRRREVDLEFAEMKIKEFVAESARLGSLQDAVFRKEEELGIPEKKKLKECEDVLARSRWDLNQCLSMLKDRKKELESVSQLLSQCCEQYDLNSLDIEKKVIELEDMKKQHEVFRDSINEQLAAFDVSKLPFESLECSCKRIAGELEVKERQLKEAIQRLEEVEKKIQSKNEELVSVQGSIVGHSESLKVKKEELSTICSKIDKRCSELSKKEKDLLLMEKKTASLRKTTWECHDDLEQKKNQLRYVNESLSHSTKEVECKERKLEEIRRNSMECQVELEKREKWLDDLLSSWDEKCKLLEMNEKNFEAKVRDFEYWQQQLHSREMSHEFSQEARLVPGSEAAIHHGHVQDNQSQNVPCRVSLVKTPVSSTLPTIGCNSSNDEFVVWKQCGRDPSKEVLDIIDESFEQLRSCRDAALSDSICRRRVYLLERMMQLAPPLSDGIEVDNEIKERALKMAMEWESKLRCKAEGQLEVLGFLFLLNAYKLVPYFDRRGITKLAATFSLNESHPGLCQAIGLADTNTVPPKGGNCSSSTRFRRTCSSPPRFHRRPHREAKRLMPATSARWPQKLRKKAHFDRS